MKYKKHIALAVVLLFAGLMSQGAHASCYAFPIQYQNVGSMLVAKFEARTTSCPQSSGDHWVEVCAKLAGSSSYARCINGYTYTTKQPFYISLPYLQYDGSYTYRLRYRKSNGSLGVGVYGPMQTPPRNGGGSSSGSSGGSSGASGGCPPIICG